MTWPLLLIVWLCWSLSYPFMAWTLEAVDLISARLLANAGAGTGWLKASVASLSLLVVPCVDVASSALLVQRAIGPFDVAALACVLGAIVLVVRRPAAAPAPEARKQAN